MIITIDIIMYFRLIGMTERHCVSVYLCMYMYSVYMNTCKPGQLAYTAPQIFM